MTELLRVEAVTKEFGGLRAVNRVDMTVEKGQILGLIGPNGSGKTTLFNLICSVHRVTEGEIYFKGERITDLPRPAVTARGIGRTFQTLCLFSNMSVLDNVIVGAHLQGKAGVLGALFNPPWVRAEEKRLKERAAHYLELLGIADKQEMRVDNLSYGDQRRLEIARALATEPDLLLLDEPSAGMNISEGA